MFGILPSYGFFIRHVEGINLDNINLKLEKKDLRHAMIINDVNKFKMASNSIYCNYPENAAIYLEKLKNSIIEKPIIYEGNKIYFNSVKLDETVVIKE